MQNSIELLQRRFWLGPVIGLIIGILLGLLVGWVIAPVSWAPGTDDVASMADAYEINPASTTVFTKARLAGMSKEDQARLFTDAIRSSTAANQPLQARRIANLAAALNVPIGAAAAITPSATGPASQTPTTGTAPAGTSAVAGLLPIVLLFFVIVLLAAAALIFLTRILPQLRAGQAAAMRRTQVAGAPVAPVTERVTTTTAPSRAAPVAAPTTAPGGLGHHVASYTLGNDNYDTSFSLETPRGEFLGECGMGISETIGEGKPDKVTAFDLWLFDKADVRTVTQILMSEYAYNDQGLRAKLAAKGEAILAEKGKTIQLETQSLRIAAQVVELVYANNPNYPPNSHFQKLTVEIVPNLKEAVAG